MMVLASLMCGLIFGFGLLISGMTQPAKVLGFLDVFGQWDPTLGFVMAAALGVSGVGFSPLRQRTKPLLAYALMWPTRTDNLVSAERAGGHSVPFFRRKVGDHHETSGSRRGLQPAVPASPRRIPTLHPLNP